MHTARIALGLFFLASAASGEPEYTVTDITGWTSSQLASLPAFHRYTPSVPTGAPNGFLAHAAAGGVVVGEFTGSQGYVYGSMVSDGASTTINPLGIFVWQRTWWDGKDLHFANGRVSIERAWDVNTSGVVVGESTIAGVGEYASEHITHAVVSTTADTTLTDITPGAFRAAATGVNASGEVCGWQAAVGEATVGFRRSPSGVMTPLASAAGGTAPIGINTAGRVVGTMTGTRAWSSKVGFVCEAGSATAIELPLPDGGPATDTAAYDLNDTGIIVGASWDFGQSYEHFAMVWEHNPDGSWTGFDLNEVLASNPVDALLENARAVSDQGYIICTGRLDGTDAFGSRRYLLTPTDLPPGCEPDLNSDGQLNFFDVAAYIALYNAGDAAADLAPPTGQLNFFDISAYLAAFNAGCP